MDLISRLLYFGRSSSVVRTLHGVRYLMLTLELLDLCCALFEVCRRWCVVPS